MTDMERIKSRHDQHRDVIYTMGYSRTSQDAFIQRYGGYLLPDHIVVDVRLTPGTINGAWCEAGERMKKAFADWGILGHHGYQWKRELGNQHGKAGLWWYYVKHQQSESMNKFASEVAQWFRNGEAPLILCSEMQPFNAKGVPQCHRVIIAELLRKRFPNVPVVHLGAEPAEVPYF